MKLGILVMILVNLLILDVPSVMEWTCDKKDKLCRVQCKSYLPSYNINLCRNAQLNTLLTTWNIKTEFTIVLDAIAM